MRGPSLVSSLLLTFALGCEFAGSSDPPAPEPIAPKRYNLIPVPQKLVERDGAFELGPDARIATSGSDPDLARVALQLAESLRAATGYAISVDDVAATVPAAIELAIDGSVAADEGYSLDVDAARIRVAAKTGRGLFYGIATLHQLFPGAIEAAGPHGETAWSVPAMHVDDAPRFPYRGMHLDVSRHFFPVEFVKRYVDLAARYKMNTLHWHLTDDQGWRIEIKKYPKLTEIGSVRRETVVGIPGPSPIFDGTPYSGFYTQDQIREVVAYAGERFVQVLPEIEMPGHCLAALASYPELACTPGPFETATSWGVFDDVFCPSEATFGFLDDVLAEVTALFPNSLVHVGGDEVPLARWDESPVAQGVVKSAGLAGTADLETWFIGRIAASLGAMGRQIVGWDEIAGGSKIPNATVMSWRGADKGREAAEQGYPVIMTPIESCYFDKAQVSGGGEPLSAGGLLTLEQVYAFDPMPDGLSPDKAPLILGAQGNLWTEYIPTASQAEYMAFPRALALAEAVWSPAAARSYPDFLARLTGNAPHLDALGVNYARQFQR
jgi:hexosaminidase